MAITQSQSTMRARRFKRRPPPFVVDEQPRFDPFEPRGRQTNRKNPPARAPTKEAEPRAAGPLLHLAFLVGLAGLAVAGAPWWGYLGLGVAWSWASSSG